MFRCVEVGLPSKWNRLPSRRSETPVETEETPVVSPRDSRRIATRLPSMAARTTAASVREANIHNIHSSQPDLYTGVCICVLTSEDCEDWKSVKDRKKKERDILLFLSLIFRSNVHKIV